MRKLVCNYAVIRFMPYPETEEFACIGVALFCKESGFFDYQLEMKRRQRITTFFPEMDLQVFLNGRNCFERNLHRIRENLGGGVMSEQMQIPFMDLTTAFQELVRTREGMFRFGETGTVMAENPKVELKRQFEHFVNRQFTKQKEYNREQAMARGLMKLLRQRKITAYREELLGDDIYHVRLPLVRGLIEQPGEIRAIKPLDFRQADTTKILEHGGIWRMRIAQLAEMRFEPERFLFPVQLPKKKKLADAAKDACKKLESTGVRLESFDHEDAILNFAQAG